MQPKKTLYLFDIDGTIANDNHRRKYAVAKQWNKYFDVSRVFADTPLQEGMNLIELTLALNAEAEIGYLTGRREDLRQVTMDWLITHRFPTNVPLLMRSRTNKKILAEFKAEVMLNALMSGDYRDVILYDDDPEVVRVVAATVGDHHVRHVTYCEKPENMIKRQTVSA